MTDVKIMIGKLTLKEEIPIIEMDADYKILSYNDRTFRAKAFFEENMDLWNLLLSKSEGQTKPLIYLEETYFAYGILRDVSAGSTYLLGPVFLGEIPRRLLWSYRSISKFFSGSRLFSGMTYDKFVGHLQVLYFAIHHCWTDETCISENAASEDEKYYVAEHEKIALQIDNSERSKAHNTYQMENLWLEHIKEGKVLEGMPGTASFDASVLGQMAKSSQKQAEYTCVCEITLLTRAAIEAGVPAAESYNISDLYLQKLENCQNAAQIRTVISNATHAFLDAVRNVKKSSDVPGYILACKDYITQHRTHFISIEDLAARLGISHGYLSKQFKEFEGMTISQYIIKEKIKAAANMLKYSDASLSEIAEYLNFSSQSHMGQYFRKEFGMTPGEYQKKYKVIEF